MKHVTSRTKNVRKLIHTIDELISRPECIEGMGLLYAPPGEGKTTAVALCNNLYTGIFIRGFSCSNMTSILGDICIELGGQPNGRKNKMMDFIIDELKRDEPRPIFVDEADYLFKHFEMVDALRDIYDTSKCPVILIGMEYIARRLKTNKRIGRRITQWVEFKGLDFEDTEQVARDCCEVEICNDLLRHVHKETGANIGRIITGLTRIEKYAALNNLKVVTLDQWKDRPLYFDQPTFTKKPVKSDDK